MPEITNATSTPEEEMVRFWQQSQLAARRMLKRKEKESIEEETEEGAARKIILWIIPAILEAIPIVDIFPSWVLKSLHSHFKSKKKNLTLAMIILTLCMDLLNIVGVSLFSGFDWIGDIILGVIGINLQLQIDKEK